jgi:hypothetical protein
MEGLLVDYDVIIKPRKLSNLKFKLKPPPKTKFNTGLILIMSKLKLSLLKHSNDKLAYINTGIFIRDIIHYTYIIFNKKVCEIITPGIYISIILNTLRSGLSYNMQLWINVPQGPELKESLKVGFHNPHFCDKSPLGTISADKGICLTRMNDLSKKNAIKDVKEILKQKNNRSCKIQLQFDLKTGKQLKEIAKYGLTLNKDGTFTQKEIGGTFTLGDNSVRSVYPLSLNLDSIIYGGEESVNIVKGLYSFHTHPKEAYDRNDVKNGWPSPQDYIGFLSCSIDYGAIAHFVVGLEGVYIISMSNWWVNKKENFCDSVIEFINNRLNLHKSELTIDQYISKIRSELYKEFPVFNIEYLNWDNIGNKFSVNYSKNGDNCTFRD